MAYVAQFSCGFATLGPLVFDCQTQILQESTGIQSPCRLVHTAYFAPLVTANPFCLAQFPFTITYFKVMYMSACLLFLVSFDTFVLCCVWPACHG